jgi:hypothetical protein
VDPMGFDPTCLVTGRGVCLLRAALRLVGWSFVAVFVGIMYLLASRFLRAVLGHAGESLSATWCLQMGVGGWLLTNVVGNYLRCIFTPPGVVPRPAPSAAPPTAAMRRHPRYCTECCVVPPLRASHCHFCDVCVLRMDHHCPWVLGCVGYFNHPYFVLYLAYCLLGTGFLAAAGHSAAVDGEYVSRLPPEHQAEPQVVVTVSVVAGLLVLAFGGFHFYLASTDQTSVEYLEGHCFPRVVAADGGGGGGSVGDGSTSGTQYVAQFDRGCRRNLDDLLGARWHRRWWRLLLPLHVQREGDGVCFSSLGASSCTNMRAGCSGGDTRGVSSGCERGLALRIEAAEQSPLLRV